MEFPASGGQAGPNFAFLSAPPENIIVPGSLSIMTNNGSLFILLLLKSILKYFILFLFYLVHRSLKF